MGSTDQAGIQVKGKAGREEDNGRSGRALTPLGVRGKVRPGVLMPPQPLRLELYTRPGCHLGNDLRAICERLEGEIVFEFAEVNIEEDPGLLARFEREVPVLLVNGRPVVRYRTSERELRRILHWQLFRSRFWRV